MNVDVGMRYFDRVLPETRASLEKLETRAIQALRASKVHLVNRVM